MTEEKSRLIVQVFEGIAPLSFEKFAVQVVYENPMPYFSKGERTIEVSHWGNINVNEYYEV